MFAGDSRLIDSWKFAIALAESYPNAVQWGNMPTTGLAVCGVERSTGKVVIEINQSLQGDSCSFAGSGAQYAAICWQNNQDAERAVETAKTIDLYSGGQVRYYRLATGETNTGYDKPLKTLNASFIEKGYVMNMNQTTSNNPMPIRDAVQHNDVLRSVMEEVSKGNITATAPHQHMHRIWTSDEKKKLVDAMEYFFPKNS